MTAVILFVFLFLFGTIVGSFLNVVALRLHSGRGLGGRSSCASCAATLRWFELVPILSYLVQGGRCRRCRTAISRQYILVECSTGFLFATLANFRLSFLENLIVLAVFSIYVVITVYDARHTIIPDGLAYGAVALALAFRFLLGGSVLDWLAGPILFLFFWILWKLSRGRAMGLGDGKLALSIGLLLGFVEGISAFALAFWIGTAISLVLAVSYPLFRKGKRLTMKSEIPFAPFLVAGAWLAIIFHADLFHLTTLLGR